jgi:hypothetical protein
MTLLLARVTDEEEARDRCTHSRRPRACRLTPTTSRAGRWTVWPYGSQAGSGGALAILIKHVETCIRSARIWDLAAITFADKGWRGGCGRMQSTPLSTGI